VSLPPTTAPSASPPPAVADAVVIGAGPNGLVAANALVDAGWDVLVLEAQPTIGGAVRSAEVVAPGYVSDLFSAFYPLAAASPVIRGLELDRYGLQWCSSPDVLAHVLDDGRAAILAREPEDTAANLEAFGSGDGDTWLAMFRDWQRIRDPLLDSLFAPLPPVRSGARLARRTGVAGLLELARLAVLPVRRLADERFTGEGAALLLTGNAMHADVPPDAAGSGVFGWLLTMLAQDVGYPVPRGGAQQLSDALGRRIEARGGTIVTGAPVERVLLSGSRAVGVRTAAGDTVGVRRAVLADVSAPSLYHDLVGDDRLPSGLIRRLRRFHWDLPTLKLNWALAGPVPWRATEAAACGTVHLGVDLAGFVDFSADLSVGRLPERPFVLFGQMATADPSRSPAGTESAWAYTHLPHQLANDDGAVKEQVERVEAAVERVAPGFRDLVVGRVVQSPSDLNREDANLTFGATNGGTAAPHQQAIFRPMTGTGRPETPYERLYLASASAHPGGGVHGACGWNAAVAALRDNGMAGPLRRRLQRTVWGRLL
jgi:phytoene dehydrogenase-like protein